MALQVSRATTATASPPAATTPSTPGSAPAPFGSNDATRVPTTGLCTTAANSIFGRTTSMPNPAVPVIFIGASSRGTLRPTIRYSVGDLGAGLDGGRSRAAASASSP